MPRRCIAVRGITPDGQRYEGIVTVQVTRRSCSSCGRDATLQCDHPVKRARGSRTCDRWLCARCATTVGPDLHHCPPHARHEATR